MSYQTPKKSSRDDSLSLCNHEEVHNVNICAVCLSPVKRKGKGNEKDKDEDEDEDEGEVIVETRCKHIFHLKCLAEVKERKPECPCCRGLLTPLPKHCVLGGYYQSFESRNAVREAATRGRNAVRLVVIRVIESKINL